MTGPADVRVYVNERGVSLPLGTSALDAVRALCPELAAEVAAGRSRLADSRGLPIAADTLLTTGAIFRVVNVRDRGEEAA